MTECPNLTVTAIPTLLSWCAQHDIWIDPRLSVVPDDEHGGLRVVNNSTTSIDSHTTLVTIPKTAVLSARSCALTDAIPAVMYGHGARLALSLALYGEMLLEECSRWHGYLQSLPKHTEPIALLWGIDEAWTDQGEEARDDARRAAALTAGTEIEKELLGEEGVSLLDEVRQFYTDTVLPTLSEPCWSANFASPPAVSFAGFLHSYSLVSSRSFLVDAYHALAMVPIADAFNHTAENHVHLESEFDVCVICGSLAQCQHDLEEELENVLIGGEGPTNIPSTGHLGAGPSSQRRRSTQASAASAAGAEPDSRSAYARVLGSPPAPEEADTCDMVANRLIPAGAEVFNTYGEQLTNAQLLVRYGFALDGNENDTVGFSWADLPAVSDVTTRRLAMDRAAFARSYQRTLALFPSCERWDASALVHQPEHAPFAGSAQTEPDGGLERQDGARRGAVPMVINGDARVSHGLWLYGAVLAILDAAGTQGREPDTCEVAVAARRLARSQLLFESRADGANSATSEADAYDDEGRGDLPRYEGTTGELDKDAKTLATLARIVAWTCTQSTRAKRLGCRTPAAGALSTPQLAAQLDVSLFPALSSFPSNTLILHPQPTLPPRDFFCLPCHAAREGAFSSFFVPTAFLDILRSRSSLQAP